MTTGNDALAIARAYFQAWTGGRFDEAAGLLADDLSIEVPVNHYPDKASFAAAVAAFGSMAERTTLLAAIGNDGEAILLYDMTVAQLGTLRIAEHFRVRDGRIAYLCQIHDTAALRAAGFVRSP